MCKLFNILRFFFFCGVLFIAIATSLCAQSPNYFPAPNQFPATAVYPTYSSAEISTPALPPVVIEPCVPDLCRTPSYQNWERVTSSFWDWTWFPEGAIYPAYLANMKASRLSGTWSEDARWGRILDGTLGGVAPLLRYGTREAILPSGVQVDIEGAATLRMIDSKTHVMDMHATDYRIGVPITFGNQRLQFKTGYYHVSSHLGDEYILTNPTTFKRINYLRDSILLGLAVRPVRDVRLYAELDYACRVDEMGKPVHFLLGGEYSPMYQPSRRYGSPFLAVHALLMQELDFSGNLNFQAGWQWRSAQQQLLRVGLQFFTGADDQFTFYYRNTHKFGFGIWYDF